MVAVNRTFLAFSLASLSLADAAVVPSPPASPSKPGPQPSSLPSIVPLPMKRMVRERANSTPKKSRFLKSRVEEVTTPLGAAFSKRQKDQARFDVHNVPRQVEEREDKGQGHVDITSPTADGNSTRVASLLYNSTTDNLDASPAQYSTMYMVSNDPHDAQDSMPVTLQMPITNSTDGTTSSYCATFDPSPPAPEPLTMTPCFTNSTAPTPHKSQTFVYNASSSVVQPMWNGTDSSSSNSQRDEHEQDVTLVWKSATSPVAQQQVASTSSSSASFAASSSSTTSASSSTAASSSASFPSKPSAPVKPSLPVAAPNPVGLQEFSSISATSSSQEFSSTAASSTSASTSSASSQASSTFSTSSASTDAAATPGAFEVHLASSSTGSTSASSTDTPPSASSSTTDAQSSSSTSTSDAGPTAAAEQAVYVARAGEEDGAPSMEWKREHGL